MHIFARRIWSAMHPENERPFILMMHLDPSLVNIYHSAIGSSVASLFGVCVERRQIRSLLAGDARNLRSGFRKKKVIHRAAEVSLENDRRSNTCLDRHHDQHDPILSWIRPHLRMVGLTHCRILPRLNGMYTLQLRGQLDMISHRLQHR